MAKSGDEDGDGPRKVRLSRVLLLLGSTLLVLCFKESITTSTYFRRILTEFGETTMTKTQPTSHTIPLLDLINTHEICNEPFVRFNDTVLDNLLAYADGRKIPRIVHVTSKSRCVTPSLAAHLDEWRLPEHSLFFHDDEAVDRLLYRQWDEFPHLAQVARCLKSGASKADLWRGLVIWEYGGIYADIDTAPNTAFANGTAISPEDESFFLVESVGVASQYFFAATPRHPLIYLLVTQTLLRLLELPNVDNQYVPVVTGPGAMKVAWIHFMNRQNVVSEDVYENFQRIEAGSYTGLFNRTATVLGTRATNNAWITRVALKTKGADYSAMNMIHFSKVRYVDPDPSFRAESCLQRIYRTTELPKLEEFEIVPW